MLVTDLTVHFASFLMKLGHNLTLKSARRFETKRFESASMQYVRKYYSDPFPPVTSKRYYAASLDLDFELNRSSDPLAKTVTNS